MRTFATFQTTRFNTAEVRDHFINDCCFGDDCAAWLAAELGAAGLTSVSEPWQEDWGWQFATTSSDARILLGVGFIPEPEAVSLIQLHESRPVLRRLFGHAGSEGMHRVVEVVHDVLASARDVRNVRWHDAEFERGKSESAPTPEG